MSCPYHRALHCRFETCDKDKAFEVSGKVSTFEDTKIVQTCTYGVGQCWNFEKPEEPRLVENVPLSKNVLDESLQLREELPLMANFCPSAKVQKGLHHFKITSPSFKSEIS